MENNLTDEELISRGREMLRNGLGSVFVVKWIRKRVEDTDRRATIMTEIMGNTVSEKVDESKLKKDREKRKIKYLFEDFLENKNHLRTVSAIAFMLFAILLVSALGLKANSYPHCFFVFLLGIVFFYSHKMVNWQKKSNIIMAAGIYCAVVVLFFFVFKLPDRFIPGFGEYNTERGGVKVIHAATVINDFSPFIYACFLIVFVYPFLSMLKFMNRLLEIPQGVREQMGINVHP